MIEVIPANNKNKWNEVIRSMSDYDFYHLASYHNLDKSGEPLLFHYSNETSSFSFPFIKRKINNTDYYDITSVYGYGGPLSSKEINSQENILYFQNALKTFFEENKIVSVYSSLHPIITMQPTLIKGLGEVIESNKTIAIDLEQNEDQQVKQYSYSLRYQISRLKKMNVEVREATSKEDVDLFVSMYRENMKRVSASSKYFFPNEYFYTFLKEIDSVVLLAYYKGEAISGILCSFCNSIMQAHLSATKTEYLFMSPSKLVWDEARKLGVGRNIKWFHLGGGRDGKNDSLFDFKMKFSESVFSFKQWNYVCDEKKYNNLLNDRFGDERPNGSFFPLYRI
ncbi:lipid II:glycine glycyltransferase (peptidoglycan interpeptide bridge formation enzyme) [Dysgonomonadaceae bacterium PH5-43]|nr:lipid II:glycine glycyltransferase (peptidoglycan interpeptide bridge formation enzyme) [Dysgonomonadaceae bacterium PH5-43]